MFAIVDSEGAFASHGSGSEGAVFSQGVEHDIEVGLTPGVEQAFLASTACDAFKDRQTSLGGGFAAGHVLNDGEGTAVLDDGFAAPGCPGSSDVIITEHACAHDGRITHAAGDFVAEPTGCSDGGEVAVAIKPRTVDGTPCERDGAGQGEVTRGVFDVALDVIEPVVVWAEVGFPSEPGLPSFVGEHVLRLKALRKGEVSGTLAHDHDMICFLENIECDTGGAADVFKCADRAGFVCGAMHDGGVELDDTSFIGQAAEAYGHVVWIIFDERDPRDDSIDGVHAFVDERHGFIGGSQAVARGDDTRATVVVASSARVFERLPEQMGHGEGGECEQTCAADSEKRSAVECVHCAHSMTQMHRKVMPAIFKSGVCFLPRLRMAHG